MDSYHGEEGAHSDDHELVDAAREGDVERLRAAVAAGVSLHGREGDFTPLMSAAYFGQVDAFELLLDSGADPHSGDPLLLAIQQGHIDIVHLWIERGLEVSVPAGCDAPLMFAAHAGRADIVSLLLNAGADVNARDLDNMTALSLALQEDQREVADLLRQAGGVVDRADPFRAQLPADLTRIDLASLAELPAFQLLLDELTEVCECPPTLSQEMDGVFELECQDEEALARLMSVRDQVRERGAHLIRSERSDAGFPGRFLLIPADDKYAILEALGTCGDSYGIHPKQVRDWLRKLEEKHPFELIGCGRDFAEGELREPADDAERLARKIEQFCPDLVDPERGSAEHVGRIARSRRFLLFWE